MAVLKVEVVVGPVEVGRHNGDIVGAVLQIVRFAHLQSGYLGNGIFLVGVLQRRCEQTVFLHRLRSVLGVYARRAKKEEFLDTMLVGVLYHVALHLHVLHDKVGTIKRVCHNAANESGCQDDGVGTLLVEEACHCHLVGKVQLLMTSTYKIVVAASLKVVPDCRTHKSVVAGYVYLAVFVKHNKKPYPRPLPRREGSNMILWV